jgi:hypothetical protein
MNRDKDFNWIIFIMFLFGFVVGFLIAEAIYDKRPVTEEEYLESKQQQWYE